MHECRRSVHELRRRAPGDRTAHSRALNLPFCTFHLLQADREDLLATLMLDRLTALAAAPEFAPRTVI